MDAAFRDALCDGASWRHELSIHGNYSIKFNKDGTGEMHAIGDMGMGRIFDVALRWKTLNGEADPAIIRNLTEHTNILSRRPELLGSLRLQIALERRKPDHEIKFWGDPCCEKTLTNAALTSRQFTVVIERGNFVFAGQVGQPRYGMRMTFDVSPYPTLEGYYYRRNHGPDLRDMCELLNRTRTYYTGNLPKSASQERASNDDLLLGCRFSNAFLASSLHYLRTVL